MPRKRRADTQKGDACRTGTKRVLAPVQGARLETDRFTVLYDTDEVKDSPDIDSDEISPETEAQLYSYYGLTSSQPASLTGDAAAETEARRRGFSRDVEEADVERVPAGEGDSGEIETLADGSMSIPVLEEELVVTNRVVVRERIVIRQRTVTREERIRAELRKERVELETKGDMDVEEEARPPLGVGLRRLLFRNAGWARVPSAMTGRHVDR
jgi:uncharacterized protein (TIGR02271 family)